MIRGLATALGLTALARLPSIWEPRWSADEGIYSAVATGILQGRRLYVDVWDNQGPAVYGWMAGVLALTRAWHPGMQMVLAAQVLVATAAVFVIAARIGARPAVAATLFGLVLAIPVAEGDLQNTEVIALPFALGGLALALVRGGRWSILAGMAVGVAAFCRPTFGLELLVLAWFLVLRGGARDLLPLALGVALCVGVVLGALAGAGSLEGYREVQGADYSYLVRYNGGDRLWVLLLGLRAALLAALLAAGLLIGWRRRSDAAILLGAWLPLALGGAVVFPRGFVHYGLEALAPLCILAAWRLRPLVVAPAAILMVLAMQVWEYGPQLEMWIATGGPAPRLLAETDLHWEQMPGYYRGWALRLVGAENASAYANFFQQDNAAMEALAARLSQGGEGRLAVWGRLPWLYVITNRRSAYRYLTFNSAFAGQPDGVDDSIVGIASRRPLYVVLADPPPDRLIAVLAGDGYHRLEGAPGPWTVMSQR